MGLTAQASGLPASGASVPAQLSVPLSLKMSIADRVTLRPIFKPQSVRRQPPDNRGQDRILAAGEVKPPHSCKWRFSDKFRSRKCYLKNVVIYNNNFSFCESRLCSLHLSLMRGKYSKEPVVAVAHKQCGFFFWLFSTIKYFMCTVNSHRWCVFFAPNKRYKLTSLPSPSRKPVAFLLHG